MEFVDRIAKKFTKKASIAITESVKTEAKKTAVSILPTLIGIGCVIAGFSLFKSSLVRPETISAVASTVAPAISRTSIVTNNWFFDEATKKEVLSKIINQ